MRDEFDNKLKEAMRPSEEPDFWLNQKIINGNLEVKKMGNKRWKRTAVTFGAIGLLLVSSVGITAAVRYFNGKEVAEQVENNKLASAFNSEDAISINETQTSGGYDITLLGMVSGEKLSDYESYANGELLSDRTYAVVAIEPSDGTKMQEKDENGCNIGYISEFLVSPFIEGYNPNQYNAYYFNGGATCFVEDGVLYWLLETDNIEVFADHTLYLGVTKNLISIGEAYAYEENTGKITKNENYSGVGALFTLPIDKSKGSKTAAEKYLKSLEENAAEDAEDTEDTEDTTDMDALFEKLTKENIEEYATLEESTVQTLTPDKDGYITWSWELEDAATEESLLIDKKYYKTGKLYVTGSNNGDNDDILLHTIVCNKDGTVTCAVYRMKYTFSFEIDS